jgi:hypothetical protein
MRIDLADLDRLEGIAEALGRLFWCLVAVAFFAAVLGSAGTGLLVLILAAASFVVRAGLEDFVRSRQEEPAEPKESVPPKPKRKAVPDPVAEPEFTVYRSSRRLRRTKSAV